ncbi:MAG: hypothetical protein ACRD11_01525 [Terriglobia bacterium]
MSEYNGYIACPIVTAYGRMLLCELDYTGRPAPAIPMIDTVRKRYDMWLLKKYGLPWLYWNVLLRGRRLPLGMKPTLAPETQYEKPHGRRDEASSLRVD